MKDAATAQSAKLVKTDWTNSFPSQSDRLDVERTKYLQWMLYIANRFFQITILERQIQQR